MNILVMASVFDKGYYTELHKEAVEQQGVTPLHRKSFEPIKSIVRWVKPD